MLFNTYVDGDPRSFMYYKGDYYINGTEVMLSDNYIKTHTFNGKKIWKYAYFNNKVTYNNQTAYFFCRNKDTYCDLARLGYDTVEKRRECTDDCAPYFVITAFELEYAIEEFTKPIKLSQEQTDAIKKGIEDMISKKDWDYPELRILWILYICVMIGSMIFNHFYILWAIATYLFFTWRKGVRGS